MRNDICRRSLKITDRKNLESFAFYFCATYVRDKLPEATLLSNLTLDMLEFNHAH